MVAMNEIKKSASEREEQLRGRRGLSVKNANREVKTLRGLCGLCVENLIFSPARTPSVKWLARLVSTQRD